MQTDRVKTEQAIVNTVSYVDAFDYPLTPGEIHRYLVGLPLSRAGVQRVLDYGTLVPNSLSYQDGLYMLPGREEVAELRRQRRAVSERLWPAAVHYGSLIAQMPFVRMVAVTGSLAVNNVDGKEDIDYLIVTGDDHLWVSRAFVLLIVRWAARQGYELCPNYFLSERALRLTDQNLYTAHEVTQMMPLHGLPVYHRLRQVNAWTRRFLPNASGAPQLPSAAQPVVRKTDTGTRRARGALESLLATPPGRWLDKWEMSRKVRKFRRIYWGWHESDFSSDCCKGHFNHHQQRAIQAYERCVGSMVDDSRVRMHP